MRKKMEILVLAGLFLVVFALSAVAAGGTIAEDGFFATTGGAVGGVLFLVNLVVVYLWCRRTFHSMVTVYHFTFTSFLMEILATAMFAFLVIMLPAQQIARMALEQGTKDALTFAYLSIIPIFYFLKYRGKAPRRNRKRRRSEKAGGRPSLPSAL